MKTLGGGIGLGITETDTLFSSLKYWREFGSLCHVFPGNIGVPVPHFIGTEFTQVDKHTAPPIPVRTGLDRSQASSHSIPQPSPSNDKLESAVLSPVYLVPTWRRPEPRFKQVLFLHLVPRGC